VCLISLKAGGTGLNLTRANNVVLLDLWWNVQVDEQAIDRCHRIGQIREVKVSKIVIRNSIEERILDLQKHKENLAAGALGSKDIASDRLDQLSSLLD
jgi:SNF2 family DNA or RNA helicase